MNRSLTAVAAIALTACTVWRVESHGVNPAPGHVEAISLLGDTLGPPPITAEARARHEANFAAARAALERAPRDADSIIWYGRRLAYLGRYGEAIASFTVGTELHPTDPRMYRHRGHRWITVRDFDRAIADLSRAADLARGRPDEIEPDGIPNALNQPIGTLKSNIAYHLALAHYLKGEYETAIPIYQAELDSATNDDRRVSTAYWLYLSMKRAGRDAEALGVLDAITRDMQVIENDDYHRMLLMYRGELSPDSVAAVADPSSVAFATRMYGVAMWHLFRDHRAQARSVLETIIASPQWPAFGYIAAEADLARWGGRR